MKSLNKDQKMYLEAAAAVYAWISAIDDSLSTQEIDGFISYLESLDYFDEISDEDFMNTYLGLASNFEIHFNFGLKEAKQKIEPFIGNRKVSEDLIKIARKAIVSDEMYNELEESAIEEVAKFLQIDESKVVA